MDEFALRPDDDSFAFISEAAARVIQQERGAARRPGHYPRYGSQPIQHTRPSHTSQFY